MDIVIRRANVQDLPAIQSLITDSYLALVEVIGESSRGMMLNYVKQLSETELHPDKFESNSFSQFGSFFWVAEKLSDSSVVGCVGIKRISIDVAELVRMAVSPQVRGLVTGCLHIFLTTGNPQAKRFYETHGFSTVSLNRPWKMAKVFGERIIRKVVVIGGTHGCERIGVELVEGWGEPSTLPPSSSTSPRLLPAPSLASLYPTLSQVDVCLSHPRAVERGVRFLEEDLNRQFTPDNLRPPSPTTPAALSLEKGLARELDGLLGPKLALPTALPSSPSSPSPSSPSSEIDYSNYFASFPPPFNIPSFPSPSSSSSFSSPSSSSSSFSLSSFDFSLDLHSSTANVGAMMMMSGGGDSDPLSLRLGAHLKQMQRRERVVEGEVGKGEGGEGEGGEGDSVLRYPELHLTSTPSHRSLSYSLDSVTPSGVSIEVGPLPHNSLPSPSPSLSPEDPLSLTRSLVLDSLSYLHHQHNLPLLSLLQSREGEVEGEGEGEAEGEYYVQYWLGREAVMRREKVGEKNGGREKGDSKGGISFSSPLFLSPQPSLYSALPPVEIFLPVSRISFPPLPPDSSSLSSSSLSSSSLSSSSPSPYVSFLPSHRGADWREVKEGDEIFGVFDPSTHELTSTLPLVLPSLPPSPFGPPPSLHPVFMGEEAYKQDNTAFCLFQKSSLSFY